MVSSSIGQIAVFMGHWGLGFFYWIKNSNIKSRTSRQESNTKREGSRAIEGAAARTVVQPRRPLKDFMWQSPMCSMRSGSTHPQFEAGLLLRLMAPPRIKVAAVLYQGSLNCGLFRSKIIKVLC